MCTVRKRRAYQRIWCKTLMATKGVGDIYIDYSDVIMSAMATQITDVSIARSTICSCADQIIYQSSASLAFVESAGDRWIPLTKGQ